MCIIEGVGFRVFCFKKKKGDFFFFRRLKSSPILFEYTLVCPLSLSLSLSVPPTRIHAFLSCLLLLLLQKIMTAKTTISTTKSSSGLTSARGLLALLEEPLDALKIHGLRCLNDCAMTTQWAEVAASLDVIESMHEDELFSRRDLAALVASKV